MAAVWGLSALLAAAVAAPDPDTRVTAIEIDLRLDTERGLIEEDVTLGVQGRGVASLAFSIHEGLSVERSSADAGVIEHRKTGNRLSVFLSPPLTGTRRLSFRITGRPGGAGGTRVGAREVVLVPQDAWYPVHPLTRAAATVRVSAPQGWTVVGPGTPKRRGEGGIWEWTSSKPLRRVAVAGGAGLQLSEHDIVTTTLRVASPSGALDAAALATPLSDPLAWYSGALAPYPFESVHVVLLDDFRGRVDASGVVVVPVGTPVAGTTDGADLLSPQWFGELLDGEGAWIESLAAFEAVVYSRDRARPLPAEIERSRRGYLALTSGDVPLAKAGRDAPDEVVRGKGSAAFDMVRLVAGDRSFYGAVTDLFATPRAAPMTLDEFRATLEQRTRRTLERVFADWFERTGVPKLEVRLRSVPASTGGWRADLSLRQKGEPYALPVEVVFHGPGTSHREIVEIAEESTSVFYVLPFRPTRVEVDPLGRIYGLDDGS